MKTAATGIILAHNNPSGNLQPSIQDKDITKKIQEACKLLDITILDHLIVVPEDAYLSFADEGILKCGMVGVERLLAFSVREHEMVFFAIFD